MYIYVYIYIYICTRLYIFQQVDSPRRQRRAREGEALSPLIGYNTHMYIHNIYIYIYVYIYIYIYIYISVYTQLCQRMCSDM